MGGNSREREVSFAGGRTVVDNLDKSLFEAIPIFIDSFGQPVLLDWKWLYKGSIRDFYPDTRYYPPQTGPGQHAFYAEQLGPYDAQRAEEWRAQLGQTLKWEECSGLIDLAFLALHGKNGEDGRLQGMLEYLGIPYTGSGIAASALGMDKHLQRRMMQKMGLPVPRFRSIDRRTWFEAGPEERLRLMQQWSQFLGYPMVVKPANQGSSIGMSILDREDARAFTEAIDRAFFRCRVDVREWRAYSLTQKHEWAENWADPKSGVGLPAVAGDGQLLYNAPQLVEWLDSIPENRTDIAHFDSIDTETTVLGESFLSGNEFSCIVIESETGEPIALPPTGIRKSAPYYDYRSKYLPGQARKMTPIELPGEDIRRIQRSCENLYALLGFRVYARIDGFINEAGEIHLNDPNTTSGMMPSSFFFHQAAEVGMNPSQFLTYIILGSLRRFDEGMAVGATVSQTVGVDQAEGETIGTAYGRLRQLLSTTMDRAGKKSVIAVIMGGSSSERHISVESGRNVFEKLSSSGIFDPISLFLTGNNAAFRLFEIPINLHLKDHADDIAGKLLHYTEHPVVLETRARCAAITRLLGCRPIHPPREIALPELAQRAEQVFIALHGRPGEDGTLQSALERVGLTYNGSGPVSSGITIDKYRTNRILEAHGIKVAAARLVDRHDWEGAGGGDNLAATIVRSIPLPLIVKPVDDGCSSGVVRIDSEADLSSHLTRVFGAQPGGDASDVAGGTVSSPPSPASPGHTGAVSFVNTPLDRVLVEECIVRGDADHFLEVTGGMLVHRNGDGLVTYEVFEPSESLAGNGILSLEEKFLAGEGQNITPARFSPDPIERDRISARVRSVLGEAARILGVSGYCRVDAFVRIYRRKMEKEVEVLIIEVNSLPGMTPATCIFHQCALAGYKPDEFIREILEEGRKGTISPVGL